VLLADGKKEKREKSEPLGNIVFYTPAEAFSQGFFVSFFRTYRRKRASAQEARGTVRKSS
jgi:hypothetical protein